MSLYLCLCSKEIELCENPRKICPQLSMILIFPALCLVSLVFECMFFPITNSNKCFQTSLCPKYTQCTFVESNESESLCKSSLLSDCQPCQVDVRESS